MPMPPCLYASMLCEPGAGARVHPFPVLSLSDMPMPMPLGLYASMLCVPGAGARVHPSPVLFLF